MLDVALPYAGFTALCLAMERHHLQVFGRRQMPAARRHMLRATGVLLLAASWAFCITGAGWDIGSVLWLGSLTAAALPLVLLLPYAPRLTVTLAVVLPTLGALGRLVGV